MLMQPLRATVLSLTLAPLLLGCGESASEAHDGFIVDVPHTEVESQALGNCWIYAAASWAESLHLSATGEVFDVSQSYWTYWSWYEQIVGANVKEIDESGHFYSAADLILARGVMAEKSFVEEDTTSEESTRQSTALAAINQELASGRLKTRAARKDAALVRAVLDDAWELEPYVKGALTKTFGKDGSRTFLDSAYSFGTPIVAPYAFEVEYADRSSSANRLKMRRTTLEDAVNEWTLDNYPKKGSAAAKRRFLTRMQKALHDRQPVIVTWDVDFNAMETKKAGLRGSFNLTTLKEAGRPGDQGPHMTVLEDYEVVTEEFGLLPAGETLDPTKPLDKAKVDAALLPESTIRFFRIKNSWGALHDDRSEVPGFPGYHDLYLDYLNGPIKWCPEIEESKKTNRNCAGESVPLDAVVLPPGY